MTIGKNSKKILVGTRNQAKVDMIKSALLLYPELEIISLNDLGDLDDSDLTEGPDFKENAKKKSEYYFKKTGIPTISTDQIVWIKNWPKDDGFIVHIRKLVNPDSERATDEEVSDWILKFVKDNGESPATFYYAVSFTDQNGTHGFTEVMNEYILQADKSTKLRDGYIFDRFMKDKKTGEFRVEQPDHISFDKFCDALEKKLLSHMLC